MSKKNKTHSRLLTAPYTSHNLS